MVIKFFSDLRDVTFSRWERLESTEAVLGYVFKFSIWGALGTGSVAGASAIFSRVVIERNDLAPHIFNASLISCGTFTAFAAFMPFRILLSDPNPRVLCKDIDHLAAGLVLTSSLTALAGMFAGDFLNPNQMIKSLTERSIAPLMYVAGTALAIQCFKAFSMHDSEAG